MTRIITLLIAILVIAVACAIEPCDGHSCRHPQLDIEGVK